MGRGAMVQWLALLVIFIHGAQLEQSLNSGPVQIQISLAKAYDNGPDLN